MNHPTIKDAERLGKRDEKEIVIILHVTRDGVCGYASWGRDKALCREAKRMGDATMGVIQERVTI